MGTLPALFDREHVETAAADHDLDPETVSTALANHQSSVEELPGVENIAYEWRKQYDEPLIRRTQTAYYVAVPAQIWDEFADALELDDVTSAAVIEVHRLTVTAACDVSPDPTDGVAYVALDRTL